MESCPEVTWELEYEEGAMAQEVERWEDSLPVFSGLPGRRDRTVHNEAKSGICQGPRAVFSWGRET